MANRPKDVMLDEQCTPSEIVASGVSLYRGAMDVEHLRTAARATARERLLIARGRRYSGAVPSPSLQLDALKDAVAALTRASIGHALIGGLAVGVVSGVPRATIDIDLAVSSLVDEQTLIEVMQGAGFTLTGKFPHSLNFRHVSNEPVQLAFDPQFDAMVSRATALTLDGHEVRVVTREDLIAMKQRAAADPTRRKSKALRDQADIALLLEDDPGAVEDGW